MIISIKSQYGYRVLINEVEVVNLKYVGQPGFSWSEKYKVDFEKKEFNAYVNAKNDVNYEGLTNHYISHYLMDKLASSVESLLDRGYQYNPAARILVDHINLLQMFKGPEHSYVGEIKKFPCFSKVEPDYIHHHLIGIEIICHQLESLGLMTNADGKMYMTDLGRKLLRAKDIPLPTPQKKEKIKETCKYCSNPTIHGICIPCRVKHTDLTMYEKSNRF